MLGGLLLVEGGLRGHFEVVFAGIVSLGGLFGESALSLWWDVDLWVS